MTLKNANFNAASPVATAVSSDTSFNSFIAANGHNCEVFVFGEVIGK